MDVARVSVQFQSIIEKLTPHDTIFAFASSTELSESALSSACSLHTATASAKSPNDSTTQRGLTEITEDASEIKASHPQVEIDTEGTEITDLSRQKSTESQTRHDKVKEVSSAKQFHKKTSSVTTQGSLKRARTVSNVDKALPPIPGELKIEENAPRSTKSTRDSGEREVRPSIERRTSSQSARPSTRDLYDSNGYKQKVKQGPRPSLDSTGNSDKMDRSNDFRPVSTLPAGLRMPLKKAASQKSTPTRPQSQQTQRTFHENWSSQTLPSAPPITPIQIPDRRNAIISNGLLTPAKTPAEVMSPKITPDKTRLMKALQMRQKQLTAQLPAQDLSIEELPAKRKCSKPEIDESILSAIIDASRPHVKADMVHVPIQDLNKEEPRNVEGSPISMPETSEGPSTQPSSVADEEEHAEKAKQALNAGQHLGLPKGELIDFESSSGGILQDTYNSNRALSDDVQTMIHYPGIVPTSTKQDTPVEAATVRHAMATVASAADLQKEGCESIANLEIRQPENLNTSTQHADMPDSNRIPKAHAGSQISSGIPEPSSEGEMLGVDVSAAGSWDNFVKSVEKPLLPIDQDEKLSPRSLPGSAQTSFQTPSSSTENNSQPSTSQLKRHSHDSDPTTTKPSPSNTINGLQTDRTIPIHDLIKTPERLSSPEHSDEHFLSDDSFIEELQSATVQEAKPVSVSKSPIKPVFSTFESGQGTVDNSKAARSVSSPLSQSNRDEEIPTPPQLTKSPSTRSFSSNYPSRSENQLPSGPMPKKIGVSSGISQRIKALEQLSSRPTSPQSVGSPPTSTFISLRKISGRSPPAMSDPNSNEDRPTARHPSPSPSPDIAKSKSSSNPINAAYSRPDSMSVTAKIVRDRGNKSPQMPLNPSEPQAIDLHQSPLLVEHQKAAPPQLSPLKPPRPRFARFSSARSGSSSSTDQKVEASNTTIRRDSFASMRSKSSRAGSEVEVRSTFSDSSLSAVTSLDGVREEKKESKRSRLIKRMSSISSISRKSIANVLSPSPKEAPIMEHQEPIAEIPSALIDIGDVNIQFPDTLVSS